MSDADDDLPSVSEIAKLATQIYTARLPLKSNVNCVTGINERDEAHEVDESVSKALMIWSKSQEQVTSYGSEVKPLHLWTAEELFDENNAVDLTKILTPKQRVWFPYFLPMKVHSNFMPRISEEFMTQDEISWDDFISTVSNQKDAKAAEKQFHDYLQAITKAKPLMGAENFRKDKEHASNSRHLFGGLEHIAVCKSSPYDAATKEEIDGFLDEFLTEEKVPAKQIRDSIDASMAWDIIDTLKEYGLRQERSLFDPSVRDLATGFREWRVRMKIPKNTTFQDALEKSFKKGLEEEKKLEARSLGEDAES